MDAKGKVRRLFTAARTRDGEVSRLEFGLLATDETRWELYAQVGDGEEVILPGPQSADDAIANLAQLQAEQIAFYRGQQT